MPLRACNATFFLVLAGAILGSARGEPIAPRAAPLTSFSGQFLIVQASADSRPSEAAEQMETNRDFVRLEPALLAISCERIKQVLWRQLAIAGPWQSRVYLTLFPTESPDDLLTLASDRYLDGWQYQLEMPDVIERDRYVRALVQVLLLEQANRGGGDHSAEIPLWLTEGLARQLLSTSQIEIILSPPRHAKSGLDITRTNLSARLESPLRGAHEELVKRPPLTFEELSWPAADALSGEQREVYQSSAQLFVGELLRFHDGPACLRAMLADLPAHYNWQFAFLRAFKGHFARLIDVEKWWAVQSIQFTSRDLTQVWPLPQSWQKLDEALRMPVEVRTGPAELPMHADVSLQTILKEWDVQRRAQALGNKLRELDLLRFRVARELSSLVEDYCLCLESYLGKRGPGWPVRLIRSKRAFYQRTAQQTIAELDALDARRKALRPTSKPEPVTPASVASAKSH